MAKFYFETDLNFYYKNLENTREKNTRVYTAKDNPYI